MQNTTNRRCYHFCMALNYRSSFVYTPFCPCLLFDTRRISVLFYAICSLLFALAEMCQIEGYCFFLSCYWSLNTFWCKVWSIIWECQQKWLIDKGKRNHAISTVRWSYNGLSIQYELIEMSFSLSVCRAPWKASTRSRKFDFNNTTLQNIEVFHFGCSSVYQALNIIYIGKRWLVYAINYWAIGCWNSSFDYWWPSWEGILLPCTCLSDIHMHFNNCILVHGCKVSIILIM